MTNDEFITISKEEYDYLTWFFSAADFGPADDDVRYFMNEDYRRDGGTIPAGYGDEE